MIYFIVTIFKLQKQKKKSKDDKKTAPASEIAEDFEFDEGNSIQVSKT